MKKITGHRHMCVNIRGMLNHFRRKSMAGLIVDKGRELSDEEARNYLYDHIEKGHKVLPMCNEDECPNFDYFGGGCPGHDVHYYDDDDKEITKEEYEQKGGEWHEGYTQAELFNLKKI